MSLNTFRIFERDQFEDYIRHAVFLRPITVIQNHHTFKPDHNDFNGKPDHMHWLESMRRFHVNKRGWKDIGQNITIFPDGKIAVCRPIDVTPAGILGANKGAICIENLGNFDMNKDSMGQDQAKSIIFVNAVLCFKFSLQPVYAQVVYHHWFDTTGKRFAPAIVNNGTVNAMQWQKTCPGTAFFGGNTINAAVNNFYPEIAKQLEALKQRPATTVSSTNKKVIASILNVRSGRGVEFPVIKRLTSNTVIQVFAESDGWSKINLSAEEWVSSRYLT